MVVPPPTLPDTLFGVGPTYTITPNGLNLISPHEYVAWLPISDDLLESAGVFSTDQLYALLYNPSTGQWESLTIDELNMDSLWVRIAADQFGYLTLAAWTQDLEDVAFEKDAKMYNYPNPVNPEENPTVICYQLKKDATISLKVYDVSGRLVITLLEGENNLALVKYRVLWDGRNRRGVMVSNNVYFCVLETTDGLRTIHKIAVLR
jgi:hypothetical protein